jgi:hypothetical protein
MMGFFLPGIYILTAYIVFFAFFFRSCFGFLGSSFRFLDPTCPFASFLSPSVEGAVLYDTCLPADEGL